MFIFKVDRAGRCHAHSRACTGAANRWVGAATWVVECCARQRPLTGRATESARAGDLLGIPGFSINTCPLFGTAGNPPWNTCHVRHSFSSSSLSARPGPHCGGPRDASPTGSPPGLGRLERPGRPCALPHRPHATTAGAGGSAGVVQPAAHCAGENRLVQDAPAARAVPAPLLPWPEGKGRIQDLA